MQFSQTSSLLHPVARASVDAWRNLALASTAILALAGVFTCLCDTPMIWDGAYQFCFSLIKQRPYFYLTRFHSYILWLPMVWLSHFTDNLTLLKFAYGLPFTLAPAASVLMSWGVVRNRAPHLILWAIFGAAAGPLPGQIFIINDSIFQQHMFWPVFLGAMVHLNWRQAAGLAVLAAFQFSHQIGAVLLSGAAGASFVLALNDRRNRRELILKTIVFAILASVAVWKALHFRDSWAEQEFTRERISESWHYGVQGPALRGLILMWCAGLGAFFCSGRSIRLSDRQRAGIRWASITCIVAAALIWAPWAADPHKWTDAANYRRWVVPLTMPFYFLAFARQWRALGNTRHNPAAPSANRFSWAIGVGVAGTFALILSIQSIVWARLTRRLMADVESYPAALVPWSRIAWSKDTAIAHWGTTSYIFVLEGRVPRKLLLDKNPAYAKTQTSLLFGSPPMIPLAWFTPVPPTPGPGGWFDFRPLLYSVHHQPLTYVARTGGTLLPPLHPGEGWGEGDR